MKTRVFIFALAGLFLFEAALPIARAGYDNPPPVEWRARLAAEAIARGQQLFLKGNLDAAEAAFHEATSADPGRLDAQFGFVRVARTKLDYPQAIALLEKASLEHPNSTAVLEEFGEVYLAAEEPARASRYFESALRLSQVDASAIVGLAGAHLLLREYDRAAQILRDLLSREPQNSHAHARLARALLESGNNREAAEEAQRAISLDEYNAEAIHTLACVRSSERKADETRSLARRTVSLEPFNFGARRLLSQYLDGQSGYEQRVSE